MTDEGKLALTRADEGHDIPDHLGHIRLAYLLQISWGKEGVG